MEYEDLKRKILMLEARARFDSEIINAATRDFNLMRADRDRFQNRYIGVCVDIAEMEETIAAMKLKLEARDMEDAERYTVIPCERGQHLRESEVRSIRNLYGGTIEFYVDEVS